MPVRLLVAFLLLLAPVPASPARAQPAPDPDAIRFTYDAADNLTSRSEETAGEVPTQVFLPDSSGRNRPASFAGTPLAWEGNGNLIQKGDLHFAYDFCNRLAEVRDASGVVLASYAYDYRDRRVRREAGGEVLETVWRDWQPIETYRNGVLVSRRTYGRSLDELVLLERDVDLDGSLETVLRPLYDQSGSLALVTGADGKPIERYSYDPYGRQRIYVDAMRPAVEQVLVAGGELWVELSEPVLGAPIAQGLAGGAIELRDLTTDTPIALSAGPVLRHGNRELLIFVLDSVPDPGSELRLSLAPETLTDYFLNRPEAPIQIPFSWPAENSPVFDAAPPRVAEVRTTATALEVVFSELVDPQAGAPFLQVSGLVTDWVVSAEDPYRLLSLAPLAAGTHELRITTGLADLAGTTLAEPFVLSLVVDPAHLPRLAYREPDPRLVEESSVGNALGFHGLEHDPITGFVYMRHRYYDPEMGRFISADPMGYADGPNPYAFAQNDPVNRRDPFGLYVGYTTPEEAMAAARGVVPLPPGVVDPLAPSQMARDQDALWARERLARMTPLQRFQWQQANADSRSIAVGLVPLIGDAKDFQEAVTGYDRLAGRQLSPMERALAFGAAAVPVLPGAALRGMGGAVPRAAAGAESVSAQAALARKLRALEGAQQSAARVRTLPDGRVRYYGPERAAATQGPTRGAALVTEHNPTTGQVRQWYESYDAAGNVVRVHPKLIDGQVLDAPHFPPTGAELPR